MLTYHLSAKEADAKKTDKEKIQGAWKVESVTMNGEEGPDAEQVKSGAWVIDAEKITVKVGGQNQESTYQIDSTVAPKTIDITSRVEGAEKGVTMLGIYSLDGRRAEILRKTRRRGPTDGIGQQGGRRNEVDRPQAKQEVRREPPPPHASNSMPGTEEDHRWLCHWGFTVISGLWLLRPKEDVRPPLATLSAPASSRPGEIVAGKPVQVSLANAKINHRESVVAADPIDPDAIVYRRYVFTGRRARRIKSWVTTPTTAVRPGNSRLNQKETFRKRKLIPPRRSGRTAQSIWPTNRILTPKSIGLATPTDGLSFSIRGRRGNLEPADKHSPIP